MGEKYVWEASLGEKYMVEQSVGKKIDGEKMGYMGCWLLFPPFRSSPVLASNLKPSLLLGSKAGLMICERAGTFVIHTILRDKHCFG